MVTDSAAVAGVPGSLEAQPVDETRTAGGAVTQDSAPQLHPARAPCADIGEAHPRDVQPSLLDIMDTAWHARPAPKQSQARCLQSDQTYDCSVGVHWFVRRVSTPAFASSPQ